MADLGPEDVDAGAIAGEILLRLFLPSVRDKLTRF